MFGKLKIEWESENQREQVQCIAMQNSKDRRSQQAAASRKQERKYVAIEGNECYTYDPNYMCQSARWCIYNEYCIL